MRYFILIPHLKIHNANALSSPYTIGFPAMTAWLGAIHALQRKLQQKGYTSLTLDRVAISCHQFDLQTYTGQGDYFASIVATGNPLNEKGDRPAFIEEARCHLEVSLLVEFVNFGIDMDDYEKLEKDIKELILTMKFAAGDVRSVYDCKLSKFDEDEDINIELKPILNKMMPGYVIVERRDLVCEAMKEEQKDALEVILDYLKVTYTAQADDKGNNIIWGSTRKTSGWIVPIAVGFQGISDLGNAIDQRDSSTLHKFAESVITLGEFIMPYRIKQINEMLWEYHVDIENNLYLCQNQNLTT